MKGGEHIYFDVFLSFRVDSDSQHVEMFYTGLTGLGLRVWCDKLCLEPEKNWEKRSGELLRVSVVYDQSTNKSWQNLRRHLTVIMCCWSSAWRRGLKTWYDRGHLSYIYWRQWDCRWVQPLQEQLTSVSSNGGLSGYCGEQADLASG